MQNCSSSGKTSSAGRGAVVRGQPSLWQSDMVERASDSSRSVIPFVYYDIRYFDCQLSWARSNTMRQGDKVNFLSVPVHQTGDSDHQPKAYYLQLLSYMDNVNLM